MPPPSARAIARWLTRPGNLTAAETAALAAITAACPHLAQLRGHIAGFAAIMTGRTGTGRLGDWLTAAEASGIPQLQSFAAGIRHDQAAVTAGLSLSWSSGKAEGTVNKMLKRQTYGRAGFPLLRQRVLLATKPCGRLPLFLAVAQSRSERPRCGRSWSRSSSPGACRAAAGSRGCC